MQIFVKTTSGTIILVVVHLTVRSTPRLRSLRVPDIAVVELRYHLAEEQAKRTIAQLKQVIALTALKLV